MAESEPKPKLIELAGPGAGQGWKAVLKSGKAAVVHEIPVPPAEAQAAVPRLQRLFEHRHPALAPVLAWGTDQSGVWVAVEPNEGTPLSTVLSHGPLTPPAAAALGTAVLSGVAALHEAGIAMGGFGATSIRLTSNGDVRLAGHPAAAVRGTPSQSDLRADVRSSGMAVCAAFGVDPAGAPAPPNIPPGLVVTMRSMASGAMGPAADRAQAALREMASALLAPDRQMAAQSELALRAGGREVPPVTPFIPGQPTAAPAPAAGPRPGVTSVPAPAPAPSVPSPREATPIRTPASYEAPDRPVQTYHSIPAATYPPVASPPAKPEAAPQAPAVPTWADAPPKPAPWEIAPAAAASAPATPAPAPPTPAAPPPREVAVASPPPAPAPAPVASPMPAAATNPPAPVAPAQPPAVPSTPNPAANPFASRPPSAAPQADPPGPAAAPVAPAAPVTPAAPLEPAATASPAPAVSPSTSPAPAASPSQPTWSPVEQPAWKPGSAAVEIPAEWLGGSAASEAAAPATSPAAATAPAAEPAGAQPVYVPSATSAAPVAASITSVPSRAATPAPTPARRPTVARPSRGGGGAGAFERPTWLVPTAVAVVIVVLLGIAGIFLLSRAGNSSGGVASHSPSPKASGSPHSTPSTSPTGKGPLAVPVFAPASADPITKVLFCSTATPCTIPGAASETGTNCDLGACKVEVGIYFSKAQNSPVSFVLKLFDRCSGQTTDLPGPAPYTPPGYAIVIPRDSYGVALPGGLKSAALVAITQQPVTAASAPLMLGSDSCA